MYNLTESQKEVLKWIVARLQAARLGDDFEVQLRANEFDLIIPLKGVSTGATSATSARLPGATFASLTGLVAAKCLELVPSVIPAYFGRRSFTLTRYGRKGVETNFADTPPTLPN